MAIITSFSRGHGMALFLVLFNRCRVPPFPVPESPSVLSGREPLTALCQVGCLKDCLFTPCILIFSKAQTHSSGSALVLFQVQSLFSKRRASFFSFSPISHFVD